MFKVFLRVALAFSILQVQFDVDINAKWIFQKVLR